MVSLKKYARTTMKVLIPGMLGILAVVLRYGLKTPQPLKSALPGEDRMYKWTQGHIFYKVFGAEDAPPLVLFHAPGVGTTSYEMRHIVEGLAKNYRVYAPDLLGFGLSDHPRIRYSAQTYIALLTDFLRDVVQRPAVVLAGGLSCNYSVVVAQRVPELCTRLVLLSPSPLYTHARSSALRRYCVSHTPLGFLLYALLTEHWSLRLLLSRQRGISAQTITSGEVAQIYAAAHQRGAHYAARAYLAGELDMDVTGQLEQLRQPTLIIWGEQAVQPLPADMPAPVPVATRHMRSAVQTATLPATGERLQEERPTGVVNRVLSWQCPAETNQPAPQTEQPALPQEESVTRPAVEKASKPALEAAAPAAEDASELAQEMTAEEVSGTGLVSEAAVEYAGLTSAAAPINIEDMTTADSEKVEDDSEAVQTEDEKIAPEELPATEVETIVQAVLPEEPLLSVAQTVPETAAEAYCVKCRQKRLMQKANPIVTKNGRHALEGLCPVCGTRLFRFVAR